MYMVFSFLKQNEICTSWIVKQVNRHGSTTPTEIIHWTSSLRAFRHHERLYIKTPAFSKAVRSAGSKGNQLDGTRWYSS